jgi:tRNA1Val (adenine37-N6)-methyltransferase
LKSDNPARPCSTESLFAGHLLCRQHSRGYRFSHDPVLLAHFCKPSPAERILDLGTGCGIIALVIAYRWPGVSLTCLEVQTALVALARSNVELNDLTDRVRVVAGDLKEVGRQLPAASFDRVVCNPPYFQTGAARPNPEPEQAIARHEIMASLDDVIKAVVWLLAEGGKVDFVYPAGRADELLNTLKINDCAPVRLREVYSYPGGPCRLVLVEAVKGGGAGLELSPPLSVQDGPGGAYTSEMAGFYEP